MFIMTETTNINATTKNVGAKPRLSLLSSKQSCTRLNSDEFSLDQPEFCSSTYAGLASNGLLSKTSNDTIHDSNSTTSNGTSNNNNKLKAQTALQFATKVNIAESHVRGATNCAAEPANASNGAPVLSQALSDHPGQQQQQQQQQRSFDKLNVSKEDLIGLLSMLKAELQSKEIALASMKLEQLKRLMNPVEISRSTLAKTYIELQDRLESKEQLKSRNNHHLNHSTIPSASNNKTTDATQKPTLDLLAPDSNNNDIAADGESDQETIEILSTLLELLDRHPLLALPRDSIYCLDYNCNELSTKNYLNLKIQHLENLIEQHRKFRYHIKERLKRSEQRSLDLSLQLELERKFRTEDEKSDFRNNGEAVLLGHIDRLKEDLEKEKASKHAIVMTLLNELLDERERNVTLSERVANLEGRLTTATQTQKQETTPPVTSQQPVCKPKVPVKPAQLLDRQLTQTQNK